jgi:N4-gp56 family major capsid protein
MSSVQTTLSGLLNPEVLAPRIEYKLTNAVKFAPLANIGYTLQGQAGNTLSMPFFHYVGDATVVAEGVATETTQLTSSSFTATIQKVTKAIEITDEAMLSAYGNIGDEAENQMVRSIAQKIDADVLTAMATASLKNVDSSFTMDTVADALVKFGEDLTEETTLVISPSYYKAIRTDSNFVYINNGEAKISGTVGRLYGCDVVVTNKLTTTAYIVRNGAIGLEYKRGINLEMDRDILKKTTVLSADVLYVAYLRDANKIIKLTES